MVPFNQKHCGQGAASLESTDMNGLEANEAEKLQREALIKVGEGLRDHYGEVLKEVIPNRLTDLLRRVVAADEARCRER
jgi:Anti-sigma factor NepR